MKGTRLSRIRGLLARLPRPTAGGAVFLAALLFAGTLGHLLGDPALRLVFGLMAAAAVLSAVVPGLNLRGLTVIRECPEAAHAGEPFEVSATIRSAEGGRASYGVVVLDGPEGPYRRPGHAVALRVAPGEPAEVRYRVAIRDRGRHRIEGMILATRYPLGFFEKRVLLRVESEITVYPRLGTFRTDPLPPSGFHRAMTATETSREKGQEEFRNLREYRPGDSPRFISWRATAHHGELMVKELQDDLSKRVTLFLESRLPPGSRRSVRLRLERAISFTASLIRTLARRRYRVRLYYFDPEPGEAATGRGSRHLDRLMESLAVLEPTPTGGVEDLVRRAPDAVIATSRSALIVPTFDRDRLRAALERFPRGRQPVVFRADGAWERSLFRLHG